MSTVTEINIPLLRKIIPQSIANDIVGVQPMSIPSASIFSMRNRYDWTPVIVKSVGQLDNTHETAFIYYVRSNFTSMHDSHDQLVESILWCEESFKDRFYHGIDEDGYFRFYFKKEQDRTLFVLKFGE